MLSKEALVAPDRTTAAHKSATSTIHCQVGNRAQNKSRWDAITKKRRTTGTGQSCLPAVPTKTQPSEEGARSRGRPHPSRSTQNKCQAADRTPGRPKQNICQSGPAASVRQSGLAPLPAQKRERYRQGLNDDEGEQARDRTQHRGKNQESRTLPRDKKYIYIYNQRAAGRSEVNPRTTCRCRAP